MKLKDINIFKNRGLFKEGFTNDQVSTAVNAYLDTREITQDLNEQDGSRLVDGTYRAKVTGMERGGLPDTTGASGMRVIFEIELDDTDNDKSKITSLRVHTKGTGYIKDDKIIVNLSDSSKLEKKNGDDFEEISGPTGTFNFTLQDTTIHNLGNEKSQELNLTQFAIDLLQIFILLIVFAIMGANIVYLSNLPMGKLDTTLPSDWNKPPYRGEYIKSSDLLSELNKSETREDLFEFLYPMNHIAFPYTYDNLYKNEELDDLGLASYVIWPMKWMGRTTAWAWSTARLLIKYFITLIKWIMTYIKSNTVTFFLGPFLIMFAISTQLTTMIGTILMYVGGFMTDTKDGWILAIFALLVFLITIGVILYGLCYCIYNAVTCCGYFEIMKEKARQEADDARKGIAKPPSDSSSAASPADIISAANPIAPPPSRGGFDGLGDAFLSAAIAIPKGANAAANVIKDQAWGLVTLGFTPSERVKRFLMCLLWILIIGIAIFSIGFSTIYNSANGLFMTIQFAVFSLIHLLFKNDGLRIMKEVISKHIKGLTILFILFSFMAARSSLPENVSNSYIFGGILLIIYIIYSMFNKGN